MQILTTDTLKESTIENIKKNKNENKIILASRSITGEEDYYKKAIIKRCEEFGIEYIDKIFDENESKEAIADFINSHDKNDGFIIFLPFGNFDGLDYLRETFEIKDIDGFTYKAQGKTANGNYDTLPATPKAVVKFLEAHSDLVGKNIVIANRTNLIGIPLANFLAKKGATVTIINSKTKNSKDLIQASDIFISAIGRAEYYTDEYFKDGQLLVDVGTSEVNGKIVGDINFSLLEDLDLEVLTHKKGIGAITTLTLLESLFQ